MNRIFTLLLFLIPSLIFSQKQFFPDNKYQNEFDYAYQQYPDIPKGILEAVSYSMTRFHHIENPIGGCIGLPKTYGVMGLTLDGQHYFRNNLELVSQLSGISEQDILDNPQQNILAYASAYHKTLLLMSFDASKIENHAQVLVQLSELPYDNLVNDFAINAQLYELFNFLNQPEAQKKYNFPNYQVNFISLFGDANYEVLKSHKVTIVGEQISNTNKVLYTPSDLVQKSADYPPALWVAADASNYSSRGTTPISAVTIHDVEGSYAGCISWFQNPSANVSAHYVLRSSDGQVTQMVLESDKAWHVGSENPYAIGLEHEGFANQTGWYTEAMLKSSADLVRDICNSGYGINPLRAMYFPWSATTIYANDNIPGSCVKIKGHQHYPNQTHVDPGPNWDWDYFYKWLNNTTPITTYSSATGTIRDLGDTANYTNDERTLILIQPTNAESITLTINQFDVEVNWDYLYIYDGTTPFDTRIGIYNGTTIPPSITVNSGNVLVEFRSDCATVAPGYEISWTSVIADTTKPTTAIGNIPNPATGNFSANFTDADNVGGSGVQYQFYQVADTNGVEWRANNSNGFFNDDFTATIHVDWTDSSGVWSITGGYLTQTDEANSNTNLYASCNQNTSTKYLYHYKNRISGSGTNKRAGLHYMCDNASLPNRGNSYFVWFRQDNAKLQFYKVVNDTFSLEKDVPFTFNANQWYDVKIVYDKTTGTTEVWWDDEFIDSWTDTNPLTSGSQVSLRSGNCVYDVDELSIYKNRTATETITVGSMPTDDIGYAGNPAGRINSIVIDSAHNVSTVVTEYVNVDLTTSVNEFISNELKVYPNPLGEFLNIETDLSQEVNILLTSVDGKLIFSKNIIPQQGFINIDLKPYQLSTGTYFLKINKKTISLIKK